MAFLLGLAVGLKLREDLLQERFGVLLDPFEVGRGLGCGFGTRGHWLGERRGLVAELQARATVSGLDLGRGTARDVLSRWVGLRLSHFFGAGVGLGLLRLILGVGLDPPGLVGRDTLLNNFLGFSGRGSSASAVGFLNLRNVHQLRAFDRFDLVLRPCR